MTFRLLGISDELRLEIEQNSPGITTEAATLIIENAVDQAQTAAEEITAESIREIQSIIGPHGTISRLQAGGIRIGQAGIGVFLDGVLKTSIDDEGNLFVGSNIDLPATTTFSAFVVDQTYNNEAMGGGDLLIGDNSTGVSNIKFDTSAGQLQFRYGQTVTAYMDTDGTMKFLAGTIGGWVIGTDSIKDAAGVVGMLSTVTGGDDIRFFAGNATPASAPFRVTEAGALVATNATITGSITATTGTIGGWSISAFALYKFSTGSTGIILGGSDSTVRVGDTAGNHIVLDGANQRIRSSNFVSGTSGFNITADTGDAEFNNITARGELKTFLLTSSNQMAVAGNIIVSKDAGKLGADVSSGATTVNFGKALTVGNWIKIQGPDSAGSNNLEWMLVGSLVSGTTYNVTRNVDGSGANGWLKDTPFVVIGASGDSRIELVAGASGSIQLITQGATWNTQTVQASMSTVAGAITAGGGTVRLYSGGIVFDNNIDGFSFLSTNPLKTAYLKMTNANEFWMVNSVAGGKLYFSIVLTDASTPAMTWSEDATNANGTVLVVPAGASGGAITLGSGVRIWTTKDGKETVFNEDSYDIDFRIESATHTSAFKLDAGGEFIQIFGGDLGTWDNSSEHRLEIGADHYFPTRNSSDKTVYFNEANQDIDTKIRTTNSDDALVMDAGLDQATSFLWDGWGLRYETWTRTGNHTFTISGDFTAIFRKGTKIRYKDGGSYEYGVVGSSSVAAGTTTVNLIPNSDYAMAAATITDRYVSHIEAPEGFPQWFAWTVSTSGLTVGTGGTVTAKWRADAQLIHYEINVTLGTSPTVGDITFTPVVNTASLGSRQNQGTATLLDAGTQNYYGVVLTTGASTFNIRANTVSGSNVINSVLSSTSPFTWGNTDAMYISGWYPY